MAVEMFQGQYISADSATKFIDYQTISDGCKMLKDAADKLEKIAKKIETLKDTCNKETLSIGGQNLEGNIEFFEKNTNDFSVYISELSDTLMETMERVYNRKQIILNEEAKAEDAKAVASHEDIVEYEEVEEVKKEDIPVDTTLKNE